MLSGTGAVQLENGTLTLKHDGAWGGNASLDIAGVLLRDNTLINNSDRIANNRNITLRGAHINLTGSSTRTNDTVGNLTLANGVSSVIVAANTDGSSLTFTGLTRNLRATVYFRGTNLGAGSHFDNNVRFESARVFAIPDEEEPAVTSIAMFDSRVHRVL